MIYTGIDPGFTGAVGFLREDGWPIGVVDAPVFEKNGKRYLSYSKMLQILEVVLEGEEGVICIEKVGPRPKQGISSAFRFGYGAGLWHGVAAHFYPKFRVEFVPPAAWKKALGVTADKDTSLTLARNLFPDMAPNLKRKMDDGRAEALLIAYYQMKFGSLGTRNHK